MHSQNPSPKSILLHHLLPEEIIEEILSRLPVKSLLRFRCVSKSWLSLVESNRFIKIHFQKSTKNRSLAHHRVVFNGEEVRSGCSLQCLSNWNSKAAAASASSSSISSIVDPTNESGIMLDIVGCCNGVLCLLSTKPDDDESFWLWNPATKILMESPKLLGSSNMDPIKYGFGWDESSGAFKVFACYILFKRRPRPSSSSRSGHVYSSKTNSWKTVTHPVGFLSSFNMFGVYVCGRIHWVTSVNDDDDDDEQEQYDIESFNLENEEFEWMESPPSNSVAGWHDTWLGEIGGCLCTSIHDIKQERIDVWVMMEYGVKGSWFKRLTFTLPILPFCGYVFPPQVGEGVNGEIFMICRDAFMIYSPKHKHKHKHDVFPKVIINFDNSCWGTLVYVESLVSPLGM